MIIKILGSGCKNCESLTENTKAALKELGLEAEIVKITDYREIVSYGIVATPGLVIDEKVISSGRVLKPQKIVEILEKMRWNK